MSDDTREVTLAYPFTDANGTEHKADATVALPATVAADLIYTGRARVPDSKATKAAAPKEK